MPDLIEPGSRNGPLSGNGNIEASVGLLQRLRQHIAIEGRILARSLHGRGADLVQEWQRLAREVAAGKTDIVHAERESFLTRLRTGLDLLKQVDELARADGRVPQEAENLAEEIASLERLSSRLATRWQDAESLEYLAAETLTPPAEKLDALAQRHGFPQAWYAQEDDPFQE